MLNVRPFKCTTVAGLVRFDPLTGFPHHLTDRNESACHKSVLNRCVINGFGGAFLLLLLGFLFVCWLMYRSMQHLHEMKKL